jgi:hypothetical protein
MWRKAMRLDDWRTRSQQTPAQDVRFHILGFLFLGTRRRSRMSLISYAKGMLFAALMVAMIVLSGCTSVKNVAQCYSDTGMGTTCLYGEIKGQPSQTALNGEHGTSAKAGQVKDFSGRFCVDDQNADAGSFYIHLLFASCKSTKALCESKGGQIALNTRNRGMCTVSLEQ